MVCRGPSANWPWPSLLDGLLGLAAVAGIGFWWGVATAQNGWTTEGARVVTSIQRIPPEMTVGYCAICSATFQYSKALTRPPKTCGMLVCMAKAGEAVAL